MDSTKINETTLFLEVVNFLRENTKNYEEAIPSFIHSLENKVKKDGTSVEEALREFESQMLTFASSIFQGTDLRGNDDYNSKMEQFLEKQGWTDSKEIEKSQK